jgi:RHS repeat-associated protein
MVAAKVTGSTVYYYHLDALGSTRLVTDASKTIKFADNCKPFGEDNGTPYCSGTCEKYKFTGKPYSQATGLYYDYHRWYDPSTGRFISADPFAGMVSDPQSLNSYAYASDSPTSSTDPTGLAAYTSVSLHQALACPSVWTDPLGYFSCSLSHTPTPVADVVAGYDAVAWGVAECEENCGQLINDAGNLFGEGSASRAGAGTTTTTTDAIRITTSDVSTDVSFENPGTIRFSQNSVSSFFRNGGSIQDLADGLRSGEINSADVPPIRVVNYEDSLYTLDNRRLVAFQQAGVDVPVVRLPLTGPIAEEFARKFTTTPGLGMGLRIIIRGLGIWPL